MSAETPAFRANAAKNALDHYNLLENMMVELGLAVRNTAFVLEGEELSEPIKITKPGRIF